MSRDFTLFQFDVDEDGVRRVLSSIPGVTPLPPDEQHASGDGTTSPEAETQTADHASEEGSTETGSGVTDETSVESAGVEAHLDDSIAMGEREATATKWTGPSTPWPGAPTEKEENGGWRDRLTDKRTLLVGGAVAALGVVGAAAVWFLKFRGDGSPDRSGGQEHRSRVRSGDTGESESARDGTEREPHADDAESRSYPVDPAPVIGMAFLAVATLVLRHVQSRAQS